MLIHRCGALYRLYHHSTVSLTSKGRRRLHLFRLSGTRHWDQTYPLLRIAILVYLHLQSRNDRMLSGPYHLMGDYSKSWATSSSFREEPWMRLCGMFTTYPRSILDRRS